MDPVCLEDMGALLLGPSSLTADPFGPLLDQDEESVLSEGLQSPLSSPYAESSSSLSPLSTSLCASVGCKTELSPLSWLPEPERSKDAISRVDWMIEDLDLGDFDLDSLIGSCDSDEPPSSPEDLLACLETNMDLDLNTLPYSSSELELPLPLDLPLSEPMAEAEKSQELAEVKSEPSSPGSGLSSPSTLDLGSEIDVTELMKSSALIRSSGIKLNGSPIHIVVVLTSKEEMNISSSSDMSDSDSGISVSSSPTHRPEPAPSPEPASSSRTKPYSRPDPDAVSAVSCRVKTGTPKVVEKKLKKMEQNKTAATRYRQKKRSEQEILNTECTDLEKRNRELAEKADSISREIQYLKNLMEEVRSAKNRKAKVGSS